MACVGLAYYAGLVCDAWPFLQLQLQRPPPLSALPPPPRYQTIPLGGGGGGWERQTPDHISESRQYLGECISAKHFGRGLLERFEGVYERVVEGFMEDG